MRQSDGTARPSIYDLAKAAGVSPGTVSRVMNNRDRVKSSTREKVLEKAHELGFKPQSTVRRPEILILTPNDFNRESGYCATLVQHLAFSLTRNGMDILLPEDPMEGLSNTYFSGIISIGSNLELIHHLGTLNATMPVVCIDYFELEGNDSPPTFHYVRSDHEQAGYLAGQHFAKAGRRCPALLARDGPSNRARLRGFNCAMEEAKIPKDHQLCYLIEKSEAFYVGLNSLVRQGADAIYTPGSSFEAVEAQHILSYVMNIQIPEQIALIGGENDKISSMLIPPLTTVEEPLIEMARHAVEIIQRLVEGKACELRQVTLPTRLIKRTSGG